MQKKQKRKRVKVREAVERGSGGDVKETKQKRKRVREAAERGDGGRE